jgi:hypothetical protein
MIREASRYYPYCHVLFCNRFRENPLPYILTQAQASSFHPRNMVLLSMVRPVLFHHSHKDPFSVVFVPESCLLLGIGLSIWQGLQGMNFMKWLHVSSFQVDSINPSCVVESQEWWHKETGVLSVNPFTQSRSMFHYTVSVSWGPCTPYLLMYESWFLACLRYASTYVHL